MYRNCNSWRLFGARCNAQYFEDWNAAHERAFLSAIRRALFFGGKDISGVEKSNGRHENCRAVQAGLSQNFG